MSDHLLFVEVLLDQNLARPLDYSVPKELRHAVQVGVRVEVPLKTSLKKGTISRIKTQSNWPNLRPIERVISEKAELSETQWKLAEWMSHYYAAPLQKVLRCFIPPNVRREVGEKKQIWIELAKTKDEIVKSCEELRGSYPVQTEILEKLLQAERGLFFASLHVPRNSLQKLLKLKLIQTQSISSSEDLMLEEEFFPTASKKLNEEQQNCLDAIAASLASKRYVTHLIQGVTGSGKTEVYLQAIQKALDHQKSAILLVPEISLTSQTIERFRSRFQEKIAILHHRRSLGERGRAWEDLKSGKVKLAIGARSALFCPIQNLGLIIVDEEHDGSYKQSEEVPCYQARDVAVMRAHLEKAVILLGSATPSIESRYNAQIGKYRHHFLHNRATSAALPKVQIIDMKRAMEQAGGFTHFSAELLSAIEKRIANGEQTLLFLNKRGYHRMQVCASCREIAKCPHCDLSLTFHRDQNCLRCHLCDYQSPVQRQCGKCGASESLSFKGFGTEHVERSLHAIFPQIRTLRMDRDTTRQKNSHEDLFKQFRSHKADVLIGTQMIAKGFHFPSVTLVGVLNPDSGLGIPDFRSPEQTFQILTQVAGRSGRSQLPGEVILQTFIPDHPVLKLAATQDYEAFYSEMIEERKQFYYPPFCRLVKVVFSSKKGEEAENEAQLVCQQMRESALPETEILPVVTAGHPKIKDLYRFQFLIKTNKIGIVVKKLADIHQGKIDVDPISTFF